MNLRGILFLSLVLVASYSRFAQGQTLSAQKIIDARIRSLDTRLNTPVTFDADRVYLGEVLEKVSAQTGVSVSIPDEDLNSGIPLTCHLKKIPLADFMNSVWSLVGFSKATWQINVDTQQNTPSYQLLPTAASRALIERLNKETEQYSGNFANLLLKMQAMTPQERQANVHPLAKAMLMDDDTIAKSYVKESQATEHFWSMMRLFVTELNQEQQAQVFRGDTVSLSLKNLNSVDQELVRASSGHSYIIHNGIRTENTPDTIRFAFTRYSGGNKKHMARNLCIGVGNARGFTTDVYMGAMEYSLNLLVYEGWILPGDLRTPEVEKQSIHSLPILPEENMWRHAPPIDLLLTQLTDSLNVSFVGVLPEDNGDRTAISSGKSAEQCLEDLHTRANLMHKWRDGILLFNYPVWFYGDDAQYSYALVKQLRENKRRNTGHSLMLSDIADAVLTLTDAQVKRLAKEFPQVEANRAKRPIFVLYKKYPGILSKEGLLVDLNMVTMLKELKLMPPLPEKDTLVEMRIIEEIPSEAGGSKRSYRLEYQTMQGKDWMGLGNVTILP